MLTNARGSAVLGLHRRIVIRRRTLTVSVSTGLAAICVLGLHAIAGDETVIIGDALRPAEVSIDIGDTVTS